MKLSDVAEMSQVQSLPSINRENQRTYLTVTGEVDEEHNVTLVTQDARRAFERL